MPPVIRPEKRQRGLIGWICVVLFWVFNALVAASLISTLLEAGNGVASFSTETQRSAHATGTLLGVGIVVVFWAIGAALLGLLVIKTRGPKVIVEPRTDT